MSIPEFTPPTACQLLDWSGRDTHIEQDYLDAARWGFDQAVAQMPTWPEPITDRRPTEADADPQGQVLNFSGGHSWYVMHWARSAAFCTDAWLHTPSWRPKPADPRQQALADLATLNGSPEAIERIRKVLEGNK